MFAIRDLLIYFAGGLVLRVLLINFGLFALPRRKKSIHLDSFAKKLSCKGFKDIQYLASSFFVIYRISSFTSCTPFTFGHWLETLHFFVNPLLLKWSPKKLCRISRLD